LNANPPRDSVTGGDVIDIEHAPVAEGELLEASRR